VEMVSNMLEYVQNLSVEVTPVPYASVLEED
jgi:hypothetical protein